MTDQDITQEALGIMRGPRAHSVRLTLTDGVLSAEWTCLAAEGADCRMRCPEDCESWSLTDHCHSLVDAGLCQVVEWMQATDDLESSVIGTTVLYDGHFDYEWDDGYMATLLDDPPLTHADNADINHGSLCGASIGRVVSDEEATCTECCHALAYLRHPGDTQ